MTGAYFFFVNKGKSTKKKNFILLEVMVMCDIVPR